MIYKNSLPKIVDIQSGTNEALWNSVNLQKNTVHNCWSTLLQILIFQLWYGASPHGGNSRQFFPAMFWICTIFFGCVALVRRSSSEKCRPVSHKNACFFWWQSHSKNTSSHTARFITQMTACFIGWENWKETSWLHFSLQSLQLHPPSHVERSVAWKVFSHFWSTLNELGPTHGSLYWTGTRPCVMEIHAQSCRLSQLWPQRNTTTDSADLYRKNTA